MCYKTVSCLYSQRNQFPQSMPFTARSHMSLCVCESLGFVCVELVHCVKYGLNQDVSTYYMNHFHARSQGITIISFEVPFKIYARLRELKEVLCPICRLLKQFIALLCSSWQWHWTSKSLPKINPGIQSDLALLLLLFARIVRR